jgi:hypothetical protein
MGVRRATGEKPHLDETADPGLRYGDCFAARMSQAARRRVAGWPTRGRVRVMTGVPAVIEGAGDAGRPATRLAGGGEQTRRPFRCAPGDQHAGREARRAS